MAETTGVAPLEVGLGALAAGRWSEAVQACEAAVALDPSPPAWEALGSAYFWLDDPRTLATRERAYDAYRASGDRVGAARVAVVLGYDHLTFHGEAAVGQGWLELAARQLDGLPVCAELGLLEAFRAEFAIAVDGDGAAAEAHALRAREIGQSLGVADLELLGRAQQGNVLVARGRVADGMRLLDVAAAAAVAGEFADRSLAGYACCYLINACDLVHDLDRAAQWCRQLDAWCERSGFHALQHVCRAEHAAVLLEQGEWPRAEALMLDAAAALAIGRPAMAVEATVRLAELRRRQGRTAEALELLDRCRGHHRAVLCRAEIALDAGAAVVAAAGAERALRAVGPDDLVWRAGALDLLVRARVATGELPAARRALDDLDVAVRTVGPGPLAATALLDRAGLLLAEDEPDAARAAAEDALDLFGRAGARWGAALARRALAAALDASGDDAAGREREAAERELRALADPQTDPQTDPPVEPATRRGAVPTGAAGAPRLTPRELEVLRLVAEGLTTAAIARRLVLSEHTVHRHVANLLTKLDASSRAAAVARAGAAGLL